MTVQTGKVKGRRKLNFSSYDELLACARGLSQSPTRQLGNWSLGQICEHLAAAMDMAIDGPSFKPSLVARWFGPLFKRRFLTRGLPSGVQLPKTAVKLLPRGCESDAGLAALERAIERLKRDPKRTRHAVFGHLTHDEWDQLQLRHAEMHLSFIEPQ
jgi:hypothetical protein